LMGGLVFSFLGGILGLSGSRFWFSPGPAGQRGHLFFGEPGFRLEKAGEEFPLDK